MSYRIGVKPGKAASVLGMIVGGIFLVLGVTIVIPTFGAFGLLWTAGAGAISVFYAYNFFSHRGVSIYQMDIDSPGNAEDLDASLRKLAKLKKDGLITDKEYEQKRAEIMRPKW